MSNSPLPMWTPRHDDLGESPGKDLDGTTKMKLFSDLCPHGRPLLAPEHRRSLCFHCTPLPDSSNKPDYQVEPLPASSLPQSPSLCGLPSLTRALLCTACGLGVKGRDAFMPPSISLQTVPLPSSYPLSWYREAQESGARMRKFMKTAPG